MNYPLVSVCCLTYNHEKYIRDTLEGFLMQKTDFNFEVIVHDDCSLDKTREIIKEFTFRYPNIFKAIYQEENQYSKGKKGVFGRFVFPQTRGKYIALCEGDDYWTDPAKLQKQIDFLESNPDFSICFHPVKIVYEGVEGEEKISNRHQRSVTTILDLARGNYIYTASCVFRKNFDALPDWYFQCSVGDYPLHMLNAQYGKIGFLNEVMAVYRVHKGGLWERKERAYRMEKWAEMLEVMVGKFSDDVNSILLMGLRFHYNWLAKYYFEKKNIEKCKQYLAKIDALGSKGYIQVV